MLVSKFPVCKLETLGKKLFVVVFKTVFSLFLCNFLFKTRCILFNIVLKFTFLVVFQFLNIFCYLLTSYIHVFL